MPEPNAKPRVVVIGAGLSGLAASYDLVRAGCQVTLLEARSDFGGLASSFRVEGCPVERFYHFICRSDSHLIQLIRELGLESKLSWSQTRTSFFVEGRYHSFGTPWDLLRFAPVPWSQRLRFGFHVMRSRYRSEWRRLDQMPAKPWLIECIGEEAYHVIWHPLLQVKFGAYHDKISAAWVWHRIWRVAASRRSLFERESFGSLHHGTATLVDPLVDWLSAQTGVKLQLNARVEPLEPTDGAVTKVRVNGETLECDAVLSTVALPVLDKLIPNRNEEYFTRARSIDYIGVVCMLLSLRRQFSANFWTNINDRRISFNGVIEQTALNKNLRQRGLELIYIPFYLPTSHPRYSARDQDLFDEYTAMLSLMNPQFDRSWVKEWHVFRAPHAQPIFTMNFADLIPSHRTPIRGLYVTDSTQFYPEDRTISAAIDQGRRAAKAMLADRGQA